jgi:hypothetical protein
MGQQVYSENSRFNIPSRKFIMSVKDRRLRKSQEVNVGLMVKLWKLE